MTPPMHDDDYRVDLVVHEWLDGESDFVPQRIRLIDELLAQVEATKQRRRWWPLIPFGRRATLGTTRQDRVDGGNDVARRLRVPGPRRRSHTMFTPVRAVVFVAILALGSSALLYSAGASPRPVPGASDALAVDASDALLFEKSMEAWNTGDPVLLEETYAPDAVHTVVFHDRVTRLEGVDAIESVIGMPGTLSQIADLVRLPDTALGEHRYVNAVDIGGGSACAYWIADDRITRHDCIVPKAYFDNPLRAGEPPTDVSVDELDTMSLKAWNERDRAALEEAFSPDLIHQAVFPSRETLYEGRDAVWPLMGLTSIEPSMAPLMLPAPEGELRWASYSNVGNGTLCEFWVQDGQIARQDCIVQ